MPFLGQQKTVKYLRLAYNVLVGADKTVVPVFLVNDIVWYSNFLFSSFTLEVSIFVCLVSVSVGIDYQVAPVFFDCRIFL